MSGFHGAFATGVASQQGTLTLPDTWFRPPFWDLLMLQLLRPNSSNLPCLYSTFHLEYPLVLSRFCFKQPSSRSVKWLRKKMEKLHRKYVFAPADKAANNVIIIWKRYYVEVLKGELNSTSTYAPAQLTKNQLLVHHINILTKIDVKIDKCELPKFYWLPKLHKRPYKSRFISNSSHCSTTILSKHITSALTAVKDHVMKYSETAFSNSNVNYFWSIKNSSEVIEKLRLRNFRGSQVSSFDFSTLYTSLPHDLIKAKVLSLVNWCFNRESKTYLCTSVKAGFFSNKKYDSYKFWSCAELCEAFTFLMENIYVKFDGMVYQQIVGIPMGTNCAPLIADLFLYCYERDFMSDLQKSKRFDLIDMFNDTSRYLDDIFTIDNPEFDKHISDIYPAELQMNKANTSDKETSFLDLNIKVIGSDIHTSVYDKRDDFGFPIVNFPWLSGDIPRLPSYGIYISQLVRFVGVVLALWISILKISKLLRNCWHRVIDITSFEKHLESSLDHTLNFCRNLVIFRSKNICQKESLTRSSTVI